MSGDAGGIGRYGFGCAGGHNLASALAAFRPHVDNPVGAFYYVEIVLYHNYGMSHCYESVESFCEQSDIVEMETCGGLIEYEYCRAGMILAQEVGQLHSLIFTTRQCTRRLAKFYVSQADFLQWQKTAYYALLRGEELDGFIDCEVEDVGNVLSVVFYFEHFLFEAFAVALLALYGNVGQELHLDGDVALAFASLASATLGVERERCRCEIELLGRLLGCHELADFVVGFQICRRVGSGGSAYWILVDKGDVGNPLDVAFEFAEASGCIAFVVHCTSHGPEENVAYEGRLARAAHSCHSGHDAERELSVDILEVMFGRASDADAVAPFATDSRYWNAQPAAKVLHGVAFLDFLEIGRSALEHNFATESSGSRPNIDDTVGCTHYLFIVLDPDQSSALRPGTQCGLFRLS